MTFSSNGARVLCEVAAAAERGWAVVFEDLGEVPPPALGPLLAREFYRKGKRMFVRLGGEEVEFDDLNFKLCLQTVLPNPHFAPEVAKYFEKEEERERTRHQLGVGWGGGGTGKKFFFPSF